MTEQEQIEAETSDRIRKVISVTWNTLMYELAYNFQIFRRRSTLFYILAILSAIFVFIKQIGLAILSLILLIIVVSYFDYKDGQVTNYIRNKKNIPNSNKIHNFKLKYKDNSNSQNVNK